jgi:hypothetical protein
MLPGLNFASSYVHHAGRGDELRINGSYPYSRYFSYQTYTAPDLLPMVCADDDYAVLSLLHARRRRPDRLWLFFSVVVVVQASLRDFHIAPQEGANLYADTSAALQGQPQGQKGRLKLSS